jgi:hypothetical protein
VHVSEGKYMIERSDICVIKPTLQRRRVDALVDNIQILVARAHAIKLRGLLRGGALCGAVVTSQLRLGHTHQRVRRNIT